MVSKSDLLFQQWVASLQKRDRTRNAINGNFEELFTALKREGLVLESAYEYLDRAIKAHSPTQSLVRNVYKKLKINGPMHLPEKEFGDNWCKDIADKANAVFFEIFPVETKEPEEDPVVYGNMTEKEYKAQRKHAEQYPQLDIAELERRMLTDNYNPVADLAAMMGTNGDSK